MGPEIAFVVGSGDRTVCADASIEPAEEVGNVLVIVAASRHSEIYA
jgi:hypothetical protein